MVPPVTKRAATKDEVFADGLDLGGEDEKEAFEAVFRQDDQRAKTFPALPKPNENEIRRDLSAAAFRRTP